MILVGMLFLLAAPLIIAIGPPLAPVVDPDTGCCLLCCPDYCPVLCGQVEEEEVLYGVNIADEEEKRVVPPTGPDP